MKSELSDCYVSSRVVKGAAAIERKLTETLRAQVRTSGKSLKRVLVYVLPNRANELGWETSKLTGANAHQLRLNSRIFVSPAEW